MRFIVKIIVSTLAVIVTSWFLSGVTITGVNDAHRFITALMVALVLAFLNSVVKPVLTFLTIPITVVTLGLFYLVLNALIIIMASKLVHDFRVSGFFTALWFSIILSIVTGILELFFGTKERDGN
ncbi:MAG: phage holin family protein [Bacteroidia bacterium]